MRALIDIPPAWLLLFAVAAWGLGRAAPGLAIDAALADLLGGLLVGAGVLLMILAVTEMRRARTTVIPHQQPSALVTGGVFARTRNPIYLGDALILTGLVLYWGATLALVLVPLFVWLLQVRFVLPEEARLATVFGPAYTAWAGRVGRWI